VIEAIDPAGRTTIERRLTGMPLLTLLARLSGADRRRAIGAYAAGAEATGKLLLPDRPYGQVLAPEPLTADTWPGFFRQSLDHWLAQNGATIAEATGSVARVSANALALAAALPERPPKGLAHGDYFPGNVLLDERLTLSGLVDFSVFTLVGDPLYDAITAALFLEMIAEAGADDVALARHLVVARHGEAILPVARFYRAYAAILMADPANAAPPYPRLFAWSVANLRALAAGKLEF
jgi:Ser/Thr protein kinase RdoA (MazF antagonist)